MSLVGEFAQIAFHAIGALMFALICYAIIDEKFS